MSRKTKITIVVLEIVLALVIAGACILLFTDIFTETPQVLPKTPTLTVETPQKLSRSETEFFTLDVMISDFGEAIYPAASFSIRFDPAYLEFLGVKEGNVFIGGYEKEDGVFYHLPEWSYSAEKANETGQINLMYLDLTGGKYAFRRELLAEEDNVVVRLSFRLRGSAREGDIYHLTVENAVFAASDETQSLAMNKDTLKVKHGKLIVGE